MSDEIKANIFSHTTWIRVAYMLVFVVIYSITEILITAVVLFQILSHLIFGQSNEKLLGFGRSLAIFVYQIIQFLTYNTDDKPFPFGDWPDISAGPVQTKAGKASTRKKSTKKSPSVNEEQSTEDESDSAGA
ncbi:MAG: DUF4389 domain-containing protein [Gammaproteobacteria bacterium]|nr:DUF4389 domain-containing protein [Gammaproteobacteria bacterium]